LSSPLFLYPVFIELPAGKHRLADSINVHQELVGVYYDQSGVQHGSS
jgi:hypothetical protein